MDIPHWRKQIDSLDSQLIVLLNQRAKFAIEIGHLKNQKGLPIYDPQREALILEALAAQSEGPLSEEAIQAIFQVIIRECRQTEDTISGSTP